MPCARGDAAPNQHTRLKLFASSGGFCQNPNCVRPLFLDTGKTRIHVAEIAHIFAATEGGPRTNQMLSRAERGSFDNLILLCSVCHTIVDKAPLDYPDNLITRWKREHEQRLVRIFGAVQLESRSDVLSSIEPHLQENRAIFFEYGPDLGYHENPESEMASAWQRKMRERIIPNSRRILGTLDVNRNHLTADELVTLEAFRQHVYDLEARHLTDSAISAQRRFPEKMNDMMRSL